ncbi:LuxR C-terminal-related transcriptional regulator [Aquimarina sp. RZ0]|uniref:LuxR C-terminal-related transcriptional regulator n=1 Tax=Aquimarina sp. RZ0 TaxID=2607730 RepID=UPI0011F1374F|nr:LuxR C-terminal-related transcriptional regulator [Aquimarina sp. RZ0]KAA1243746.1 response regulator transcription factor [Aquimarina sp. RZ0]
MPYKILHFDDCQMTKLGFKQITSDYSHIELASNYKGNNNEYILSSLTNHNPDILVINLDTISNDIVSNILTHVTCSYRKIRTVLVSNSISKHVFESFFAQGVLGFLYLNSKKQDIIDCIKKVCRQETYISNEFREKFRKDQNTDNFIKDGFKILTPKELKVIELIILGKTSNEIAKILHNSKRTIETHRQHIAEKFDILGQGRLTLFLIKRKALIIELLNNYRVIEQSNK